MSLQAYHGYWLLLQGVQIERRAAHLDEQLKHPARQFVQSNSLLGLEGSFSTGAGQPWNCMVLRPANQGLASGRVLSQNRAANQLRREEPIVHSYMAVNPALLGQDDRLPPERRIIP